MIDDVMNRTKVKRGSALPQAKLDEDDVRLIRSIVADRTELDRRRAAMTNRALAEKFGVTHSCIDKITEGMAWAHVA